MLFFGAPHLPTSNSCVSESTISLISLFSNDNAVLLGCQHQGCPLPPPEAPSSSGEDGDAGSSTMSTNQITLIGVCVPIAAGLILVLVTVLRRRANARNQRATAAFSEATSTDDSGAASSVSWDPALYTITRPRINTAWNESDSATTTVTTMRTELPPTASLLLTNTTYSAVGPSLHWRQSQGFALSMYVELAGVRGNQDDDA